MREVDDRMGLDITVYLNPRPATEHEIAATTPGDPAANLVALDKLEAVGALPREGWAADYITRVRAGLASGEPIYSDEDAGEVASALRVLRPWINPDFAARAADLAGLVLVPATSWSFRAGSYTGYNRWRRALAKFAGVDDIEEFWRWCTTAEESGHTPPMPFWQLLHFSDAEGTIGPAVCRALADDFDAMAEAAERRVDPQPDDDGWWLDKYMEWRRAFRDAADTGGWIEFH